MKRKWPLALTFTLATGLFYSCGDDDEDKDSETSVDPVTCTDQQVEVNGQCVAIQSGQQPGGSGDGGGADSSDGGGDGNLDDAGDDGEDTILPPPQPTITVNDPSVARRVVLDTNVAQRTITFVATEGAVVECSLDNINFGPCASNTSLVWQPEDFNSPHYVRATVTNAGGSNEWTATITPAEKYQQTFDIVACDVTVSTGGDFDAFAAAVDLTTADQTICFIGNPVFTKDGDDSVTSFDVAANNITLIAPVGEKFSLVSDAADIFTISGQENVRIVGADLSNATGHRVVHISASSENVDLIDIDISCLGNQTGSCVELDNSGYTNQLTLEDCHIERDNTGNGSALQVDSSSVAVNSCVLSGGYHAINGYWGSVISVWGSTLSTTATSASSSRGVVQIRRDTDITIDQSTIRSDGDHHVVVDYFNETIGNSVRTDNTRYVRTTTAGTGPFGVFYLADGAEAPELNSTTNGNLFCNNDPGVTGPIDEVIDAGGNDNSAGNLVVASQENSGNIVTCPAE